jgi:hypothetical protein
MNEWKELGKNGQRGFEYGEFWLARASFSPFLCSFLCRRVIAYLLSSSSKKKSTTTLHGGKSIFWERIPAFHFLKKEFQYRWGSFVSIKIESSLLFFLDCRNMWDNTTSLEHPFAMLSLSWHSALMRSIEETLIGEVRWFLIEINHWKYHKVFKFHMRIFARRWLVAIAVTDLWKKGSCPKHAHVTTIEIFSAEMNLGARGGLLSREVSCDEIWERRRWRGRKACATVCFCSNTTGNI